MRPPRKRWLFKRPAFGLSWLHRNTFSVKSVLLRLARQISAVTAPRRWLSPRLWALVAGLLIAAQLGLMLHQAQHHLRADVVATDDCALCKVAAGMATGPAAPLLVLPVFVLLAVLTAAPAAAPVRARAHSSFRSRAPPVRF